MIYTTRPRGRRSLGFLLAAGLALGLTACDQESDTAVALRDAQDTLRALTPAGVQPITADHRAKIYGQVRSRLQGATTGGTRSENAAAAVLLAQAQAGLAEGPAAQATALMRESLDEQTRARAVLTRWLTHTALADAAARFDPAPELAAVEADVKTVDEALAAQETRKAEVERHVADLRRQSQQRSAQSRDLQQQAGGLRARIPNETAVTGADLMDQAREISRRGDALEVEGANLEARAAQVAPQIGEIDLEIAKLNLQKTMLADSRAGIEHRTREAREQEAGARAEARAAFDDLSRLVQSLLERQEQIKTGSEEAAGGFQSAAQTARPAASEIRSSAQMTVGAAMQSAGDVQWALAQSYQSTADLLDSIGGAAFPPPDAAAFKTGSEEARTAAKTALDAATESYQSAHEAFTAAGASGPAADAMDKLTGRLSRTVGVVSGGSIDLGQPAGDGGATPGDEEPPAGEGDAGSLDPDSPNATIQKLIEITRAARYDEMADLFAFDTPEQKRVMGSLLALAPKVRALNDAMVEAFGEGMQEMAGMGGMSGPDMSAIENLSAADIAFEIDGDEARADVAGEPVVLKRVGDRWLISAAEMGANPEQLAMAAQLAPVMAQAFDEITADIKSGKIKSAQAAQAALAGKLARAMGAQVPGGGG